MKRHFLDEGGHGQIDRHTLLRNDSQKGRALIVDRGRR
jgi:hypothetical protein